MVHLGTHLRHTKLLYSEYNPLLQTYKNDIFPSIHHLTSKHHIQATVYPVFQDKGHRSDHNAFLHSILRFLVLHTGSPIYGTGSVQKLRVLLSWFLWL